MDNQTRLYLKKLIDDASEAYLLNSVLQRFSSAMSPIEIHALQKAIGGLSSEAMEYLGIDETGRLIGIEDVPPLDESADEPTGEDPEEPEEVPVEKPTKKTKKEGYT